MRMNTPMKLAMTRVDELTSNTARKALWVFSGIMPTKAALDALRQADGSIMSNSLKALGTLRLSMLYSETMKIQYMSKTIRRWPLLETANNTVVHSPGVASWFAFVIGANLDSPNFVNNVALSTVYVGSVGDIGDSVDMELLSKTIETDMSYATNDIELRLP